MLAKILKIDPWCTALVKFYTIEFVEGENQESEIDKFFNKLSQNPSNKEELDMIQSVIEEIGVRGAKKFYFNREENDAYALPPYQNYIASNDYGIN